MIHMFKNNGYDIVLDVNSGSVHVVDDVVYDLIPVVEKLLVDKLGTAEIPSGQEHTTDEALSKELFDQIINGNLVNGYDKKDISEGIDEILELRSNEVLYTDDVYEEYVEEFNNRETVVKALCLNIAHDCNLRCKYCFAAKRTTWIV